MSKVKDSPDTNTTVKAESLVVCNNCGTVFRPPHDKINTRTKSNITGKQYYLTDECGVCGKSKPTLIFVEELWGIELKRNEEAQTQTADGD